MPRYCLVTGGAGYVGSHFCKALAERTAFTPLVLDNLSRGHEAFVKWGPLIKADIRNAAELDRAFQQYTPEAVFHFAGLTYVGESVEHPADYYDVNFCGAKTLVDAMLRHDCKQIVFSSTAATYGIPQTERIGENHPQNPINPYGWSKRFVEQLLDDYANAYGLRSAALRYFNASGADEGTEIGERHDPETHLIPLILQAALGQRPNIKIFGTDYPTPDGTAIRDYIHVTDLADAHIRAMQHIGEKKENLRLNLGTGRGYSVREVIETVRRVTGRNFDVVETERRAGDPPILVASSDKAQKMLGWTPEKIELEKIVETAWRWHEGEAKQ